MTRARPAQQTPALLQKLHDNGVEFIIIGGVAAIAYGATTQTMDLDVAVRMSPENLAKVMLGLAGLHPTHVLRPDLGEIRDSPEVLATYRSLLLHTDLGRLDIMGQVEPIGGIDALRSVEMEFAPGLRCGVLDIEQLIAVKAHVARPKDKIVEAELRAILEKRSRP